MKKLFSSIFSIVLAVTAYGQNIEQVFTKDGSEYDGYICEQVPGKKISVYAEKAVIVFPSDSLKYYREDYRLVKDLTPLAQEWFMAQGDTAFVRLSSFEANGEYYDDVIIKSKDKDKTVIISFAHKTYRLDWNTIVRTTKTYPEEVIPYGIRDVVTLKTGEQYRGTIVEQTIGKSIIVRTEDGNQLTLDANDILSTRVEKISNTCDIWAQSPLLDRIEIKGGGSIEGIIIARIMGQKLKMLPKNGQYEESYNLAEVTKYQKFTNVGFEEYVPPVVDTVKVLTVNGQEFVSSSITEYDGINYIVPKDTISVTNGGTVKIVAKNIECNKTASLYLASPMKFKAKQAVADLLPKQSYPAFSKEDWPVYECSVSEDGGQVVIECKVKKKGMYFLQFTKEDGIGIFIISQ